MAIHQWCIANVLFLRCERRGGGRRRQRESCVCFPAPLDTDRVTVRIKVRICVPRCFIDTNRKGEEGECEICGEDVNFLDSKSWGKSQRKSQNTGYLFSLLFRFELKDCNKFWFLKFKVQVFKSSCSLSEF